jgi:hypothetical protein
MPTYKIIGANVAFGGKQSQYNQKFSVNLSLEGVTEHPVFEVDSLEAIDNGAGLVGKMVAGEIQHKTSKTGKSWTKFAGVLVDGVAAPAASAPVQDRDTRIEDQVIFKGAIEIYRCGELSADECVGRAVQIMDAVKARHEAEVDNVPF